MNSKTAMLAVAAGLLLLVGVTFAGDRSDRLGPVRGTTVAPDRNQPIFSAVEIIQYPDRDNSIGRFDSRTGAIYRWRGNAANPSSRSTWELRVPPVREAHSGRLEIQQINAAKSVGSDPRPGLLTTFLVDVVSGDTWILRLRDNENGTWDPVPIFR